MRCKRYPNCKEVLPISQIERHEKISCKFLPCRQCGMNLKEGKVSMQAHLQLHCMQTKMQCEFCKTILTRQQLLTSHKCSAIYPASQFAIKPDMVKNASIIPADFTSIVKCFFCDNYLRNPQQCAACHINVCENCTSASMGGNKTLNCPNKLCGVQSRFQPISRMAQNLLSKL